MVRTVSVHVWMASTTASWPRRTVFRISACTSWPMLRFSVIAPPQRLLTILSNPVDLSSAVFVKIVKHAGLAPTRAGRFSFTKRRPPPPGTARPAGRIRLGGPMSIELGGGSTREQGIADALRAGGQDVFVYLYETLAAPLYDYCADLLDDAVTACDVVQDSLVAVDTRITALPDPGRLRVSLYATARHACLRKLSGPGTAPPAADQAPAPEQTPAPDDLDLALLDQGAPGADGETRSAAAAAPARPPDRDREALNLAFRHDIVGQDLARVLGISPYRARSLLHAAGVRFSQAAAVAAALQAGPAACRTL